MSLTVLDDSWLEADTAFLEAECDHCGRIGTACVRTTDSSAAHAVKTFDCHHCGHYEEKSV